MLCDRDTNFNFNSFTSSSCWQSWTHFTWSLCCGSPQNTPCVLVVWCSSCLLEQYAWGRHSSIWMIRKYESVSSLEKLQMVKLSASCLLMNFQYNYTIFTVWKLARTMHVQFSKTTDPEVWKWERSQKLDQIWMYYLSHCCRANFYILTVTCIHKSKKVNVEVYKKVSDATFYCVWFTSKRNLVWCIPILKH